MHFNNDNFAVLGAYMHTPIRGQVEHVDRALFVIDGAGVIRDILEPDSPAFGQLSAEAKNAGRLTELGQNQYLLPGLIDLHVHAPQFPQLGTAMHISLDQWLQEYVFPLEARYADRHLAKHVYNLLVDTLLANGTTTALYFATVHLEGSRILAEVCFEKGQRAVVGKVSMDHPDQCPDFYRDKTTQEGLESVAEFVESVRSIRGNNKGLVCPAITPRFIPSCTDEMLLGLGAMAQDQKCYIQTHCSESDWEHSHVLNRFGKSDAESLAGFGLMTDSTILAHSNFISDADMMLIKTAESAIAHCPLSNIYFSNAVFPARRALEKGLTVGLGTDISGGASPSLLVNCQMAVNMSRLLEEGVDPSLPPEKRGIANSRISFREAFWMATAGGGLALNKKIGVLKPGYCFDAIVVDLNVPESNIQTWPEVDRPEDLLQKIIFNATRTNITKVWVDGQTVVETP